MNICRYEQIAKVAHTPAGHYRNACQQLDGNSNSEVEYSYSGLTRNTLALSEIVESKVLEEVRERGFPKLSE